MGKRSNNFMRTIHDYLSAVSDEFNIDNKCGLVLNLFNYILTNVNILMKPRFIDFRGRVITKVDELLCKYYNRFTAEQQRFLRNFREVVSGTKHCTAFFSNQTPGIRLCRRKIDTGKILCWQHKRQIDTVLLACKPYVDKDSIQIVMQYLL